MAAAQMGQKTENREETTDVKRAKSHLVRFPNLLGKSGNQTKSHPVHFCTTAISRARAELVLQEDHN